jgi:hypothetical protein
VAHPAAAIDADVAIDTERRRASWIDWLVRRVEDLPGPTWAAYVVLAALGIAVGNAIPWLDGKPITLDPYWTVFGLFPVSELALIHYLDWVADGAVRRFRPLTGLGDEAFERLRRRFVSIPPGSAGVFAVLWVVGGFTSSMIDPGPHRLIGVSVPSAVVTVVFEAAINGLLSALIIKAFRRMLDVERIHRAAPRIDLFDPAPLYAFSRLTSQTAIGFLYILIVLIPSLAPRYLQSETTRIGFTALVVGLTATAVAVFILPLYGMHRRIVAEKERLQSVAGERLRGLLDELERDAAHVDLSRADGLNKLLASVISERELINKLPTWPWQAATLRGFVSALLLPVVVYLMARTAERVVL